MKLSVLSDNRTLGPDFRAEHGLCIHLDTGTRRILLDCGASDNFICNAQTLGIDLSDVDYLFISHGHADHTGGLGEFMKINSKARVIIHEEAVKGRFYSLRGGLHSITSTLPDLSGRIADAAEGIAILKDFQHRYPLPKSNAKLMTDADEGLTKDLFRHEMALYTDGILYTGCAHNGLMNILSACPSNVNTVIGGFHMPDPILECEEDELNKFAQELADEYPHTTFYTGHCTGDSAFEITKKHLGPRIKMFRCGQQFDV